MALFTATAPAGPSLALTYLTDVEGDWAKFERFVAGNPAVHADAGGGLALRDGFVFVYGGDALDNGPGDRRLLQALLDLKMRYPDRVVLIAGNRDLNKLRLARELVPPTAERLRHILTRTMGAARAFDFRREELGAGASEDDVVRSYLDDIEPEGLLVRYLAAAQLGYAQGPILVVHGAVTDENFLRVPRRRERLDSVGGWVRELNGFHDAGMRQFRARREAPDLIAYQSRNPATPGSHQESVVYGRNADGTGNPQLPGIATLDSLARNGTRWVLGGHTPNGESPSILRARGLTFVLADNSPRPHPSFVTISADGEQLSVTSLASSEEPPVPVPIAFTLTQSDGSPVGKRVDGGWLVKGMTADGTRYLLSRVLRDGHEYRAQQRLVTREALAAMTLTDPVRPAEEIVPCAAWFLE